jgi:hypothetical protein
MRTVEQAGNVEADHSHQLLDLLVLLALQAEFLSEGLSEALVGDGEGLLNLLLDDVLVEELGEGLGDLALHEFGDALEGVSSALELVEVFQGKAASGREYILRRPSTSLMYFWRF